MKRFVKKYYTLIEATKYLADATKQPISENDVIYIAAQSMGCFRLCVLLDECCVAKFPYYLNKPDIEIKKFSGFVKIPEKYYTFDKDETISIDYAEVVEPIQSKDGKHIIFNPQYKHAIRRLHNQEEYKDRFAILPFEEGKKLEFNQIIVQPQKIRIPEQDLLNYVANIKHSTENIQHTSSKAETVSLKESSDEPLKNEIPGKLPNIAVGICAIKAAWELERAQERRPTDDEVMNRLQTWAKNGDIPDILLEPKGRGVTWLTKTNKKREYTILALGKALKKWYESR